MELVLLSPACVISTLLNLARWRAMQGRLIPIVTSDEWTFALPGETVDVWARTIAIVGALVAVLGLFLQYVQHRQKRPRLRLEVGLAQRATTAADGSKVAYALPCHLVNIGGLGTGVAEVRHFVVDGAHEIHRGSFVEVGEPSQERGESPERRFLGPSDHMSWQEDVVLTPPVQTDVQIRVEVAPITGAKTSTLYQLSKSPEPGGSWVLW